MVEPTDEDMKNNEGDVAFEKEKPKMKSVENTIWDWEVLNDGKPIWTRK